MRRKFCSPCPAPCGGHLGTTSRERTGRVPPSGQSGVWAPSLASPENPSIHGWPHSPAGVDPAPHPPSLSHWGLAGLLVGSCPGKPSPWALQAGAASGRLISPCGSLHPAHLAVSSHAIRKTSLVIPAELLLVCCCLDRAGGRGQHPAPAKCSLFNSDDLDSNPNATFYFQAARCLSAFASTSVKWV